MGTYCVLVNKPCTNKAQGQNYTYENNSTIN